MDLARTNGRLVRRIVHRVGSIAARSAVAAEAGLFLLVGALYFMNPLRFQYPVGYAGLYSQMSTAVRGRIGLPPVWIPQYGPVDLPFAYPPLGFYVSGWLSDALDISLLSYARFAPAVLTMVALVLLYQFIFKLTGNRAAGAVAAVLTAVATGFYNAHATGAGIIRALALTLVLATVLVGLRVFRASNLSYWWGALAGLLLGLVGLTHPSYLLFAGIGIACLAAFERSIGKASALKRLAVVAGVAGAVLAPWIFMVVSRYGMDAFLAAGGTHSTLPVWRLAQGRWDRLPVAFVELVMNLGSKWTPSVLAGLGLLGLGFAVWKRKWFLPSWLLLTVCLLGESARFEEMLAAALVSAALVGTAPLWTRTEAGRRQFVGLTRTAMYALVVGVVVYQGARAIYNDRPALTPELHEAALWLRDHSPTDSTFLSVPNHHSRTEWLPFLAQRRLAIAHWGTEWAGDYARQQALQSELAACSEDESINCLNALTARLPLDVDYLIVGQELGQLKMQIEDSSAWALSFENEAAGIYRSNETSDVD